MINKLKGNAVLAAFVISLAIFILCSFGVDAAYIISSRYKLQKVTEAIAYEYASTRAQDIMLSLEDSKANERCKQISDRYNSLYNIQGSGLTAFKIDSMEYKVNINAENIGIHSEDKKNAAVRIKTNSKVMPFFLKLVGVKSITLNARVSAVSERVIPSVRVMNVNTPPIPIMDSILLDDTDDKTKGVGYIEFGNRDIKIPPITSKPYICPSGETCPMTPDFEIDFRYIKTDNSFNPPRPVTTDYAYDYVPAPTEIQGGGYFVFAGDGNNRWTSIGQKVLYNNQPVPYSNVSSKNATINTLLKRKSFRQTADDPYVRYFCLNAAHPDFRKLRFSLANNSLENKSTGDLKRVTSLRIYKAFNSGEKADEPGEHNIYAQPCDNYPYTKDASIFYGTPFTMSPKDYVKRPVRVIFTVLNNVRIVKNKVFEEISQSDIVIQEVGVPYYVSGVCPINADDDE